jgi:hypothetical protein
MEVAEQRERPIQFRPGDIVKEVEERTDGTTSPDLVAKRDLSRYYTMLRRSLLTMSWSRNEAMLLVDALSDLAVGEGDSAITTAELAWAKVDNAIRDQGLARKWNVNGTELVKNLRDMTVCHSVALIDAVERYRALGMRGADLDELGRLKVAGLLR